MILLAVAYSLSDKKNSFFLHSNSKKITLKIKRFVGLFFVVNCLVFGFSQTNLANVVTVDGLVKGDHSKAEQSFHAGMRAYIDSNFQNAYKFWKEAEANNHPKATFNLGRMWLLGQVPNRLKNEKLASEYFEKSARLGYAPVQQYVQSSPLKNADLNEQQDIAQAKINNEKSLIAENNKPNSISNAKSINDWLNQYSDNSWVIQIFASQERNLLRQMVRDFSLKGETNILTERINGQVWYKLVYGNYANKQLALNARDSLPERLRKEKPWVREIAALKNNQ